MQFMQYRKINQILSIQNFVVAKVQIPDSLFIPSISIVMCFFKREEFIPSVFRTCIEDQDLIQSQLKIEIICVNDASPDNTFSKLQAAKSQYESSIYSSFVRFVLFNLTHNMGTLYARYYGYSHASGSYIMSLDPDDEFIPGIVPKIYFLTKDRHDIDAIQFISLEVNETERDFNGPYEKRDYVYKSHIYREPVFPLKRNITLKAPYEIGKYSIFNHKYAGNSTLAIFPPALFELFLFQRHFMYNLCFTAFSLSVVKRAIPNFDPTMLYRKYSFSDDYYSFYVYLYFCHHMYILDEYGYAYFQHSYRVRKLSIQAQKVILYRMRQELRKLFNSSISRF